MEPRPFHEAQRAPASNDQEAAYRRVRQALIDNPNDAHAWLAMSQLVSDITRQHECLQRALALEPGNPAVRERIEALRLRNMFTVAPARPTQRAAGSHRLGEYLVERQLLSADQLDEALREQRQLRRRGEIRELGEILVARGWVSPAVLARTLVAQSQVQQRAPRFLGEALVATRVITTLQLEAALEEQIKLRHAGQFQSLGNVLVRQGALTPQELRQALAEYRTLHMAGAA